MSRKCRVFDAVQHPTAPILPGDIAALQRQGCGRAWSGWGGAGICREEASRIGSVRRGVSNARLSMNASPSA
jgi:hypothetical protein